MHRLGEPSPGLFRHSMNIGTVYRAMIKTAGPSRAEREANRRYAQQAQRPAPKPPFSAPQQKTAAAQPTTPLFLNPDGSFRPMDPSKVRGEAGPTISAPREPWPSRQPAPPPGETPSLDQLRALGPERLKPASRPAAVQAAAAKPVPAKSRVPADSALAEPAGTPSAANPGEAPKSLSPATGDAEKEKKPNKPKAGFDFKSILSFMTPALGGLFGKQQGVKNTVPKLPETNTVQMWQAYYNRVPQQQKTAALKGGEPSAEVMRKLRAALRNTKRLWETEWVDPEALKDRELYIRQAARDILAGGKPGRGYWVSVGDRKDPSFTPEQLGLHVRGWRPGKGRELLDFDT